jgi:hypothetical protein
VLPPWRYIKSIAWRALSRLRRFDPASHNFRRASD